MRKNLFILGFIFILGIALRFYELGNVPDGFHRDEAFLGYNAYSILKTGKDINGNFLPLHLQSFLYSPAGYSYFSIPFIRIFDLNVFSIRFASFFFGSLTIITTFFLVRILFFAFKYKEQLAVLSSLFLAISPWHINLSRTATENTIAVFFISLGVYLFLIWVKKDKFYFLIFSFFSFGITLFLYQAPRAFLPFFIPLMILSFMKIKEQKEKIVYLSIIFLTVIIIPLLMILSSKELSLRIRTVSFFAGEETKLRLNEQIREDGVAQAPIFISRIFHNKITGYSNEFWQNYFNHFSYKFLFTEQGLPERYKVPLMGLIYNVELPFLIMGLFLLLLNHRKIGVFLIGWILLAPIGSSLTFDDVPNLQRTLIIFPALPVVSAFGLISFLNILKRKIFLYQSVLLIVAFVTMYSFLFYFHQYYLHVNKYRPWYRQDGYKELVQDVNKLLVFAENKKAIVTNRESAPTIFFLFYSKYPPDGFQKKTRNTKMKDFDRISFGKFEFSQEECPLKLGENGEYKKTKDTVFVNSGLCREIPNAGEVKVERSDGSTAFRIYPAN